MWVWDAFSCWHSVSGEGIPDVVALTAVNYMVGVDTPAVVASVSCDCLGWNFSETLN